MASINNIDNDIKNMLRRSHDGDGDDDACDTINNTSSRMSRHNSIGNNSIGTWGTEGQDSYIEVEHEFEDILRCSYEVGYIGGNDDDVVNRLRYHRAVSDLGLEGIADDNNECLRSQHQLPPDDAAASASVPHHKQLEENTNNQQQGIYYNNIEDSRNPLILQQEQKDKATTTCTSSSSTSERPTSSASLSRNNKKSNSTISQNHQDDVRDKSNASLKMDVSSTIASKEHWMHNKRSSTTTTTASSSACNSNNDGDTQTMDVKEERASRISSEEEEDKNDDVKNLSLVVHGGSMGGSPQREEQFQGEEVLSKEAKRKPSSSSGSSSKLHNSPEKPQNPQDASIDAAATVSTVDTTAISMPVLSNDDLTMSIDANSVAFVLSTGANCPKDDNDGSSKVNKPMVTALSCRGQGEESTLVIDEYHDTTTTTDRAGENQTMDENSRQNGEEVVGAASVDDDVAVARQWHRQRKRMERTPTTNVRTTGEKQTMKITNKQEVRDGDGVIRETRVDDESVAQQSQRQRIRRKSNLPSLFSTPEGNDDLISPTESSLPSAAESQGGSSSNENTIVKEQRIPQHAQLLTEEGRPPSPHTARKVSSSRRREDHLRSSYSSRKSNNSALDSSHRTDTSRETAIISNTSTPSTSNTFSKLRTSSSRRQISPPSCKNNDNSRIHQHRSSSQTNSEDKACTEDRQLKFVSSQQDDKNIIDVKEFCDSSLKEEEGESDWADDLTSASRLQLSQSCTSCDSRLPPQPMVMQHQYSGWNVPLGAHKVVCSPPGLKVTTQAHRRSMPVKIVVPVSSPKNMINEAKEEELIIPPGTYVEILDTRVHGDRVRGRICWEIEQEEINYDDKEELPSSSSSSNNSKSGNAANRNGTTKPKRKKTPLLSLKKMQSKKQQNPYRRKNDNGRSDATKNKLIDAERKVMKSAAVMKKYEGWISLQWANDHSNDNEERGGLIGSSSTEGEEADNEPWDRLDSSTTTANSGRKVEMDVDSGPWTDPVPLGVYCINPRCNVGVPLHNTSERESAVMASNTLDPGRCVEVVQTHVRADGVVMARVIVSDVASQEENRVDDDNGDSNANVNRKKNMDKKTSFNNFTTNNGWMTLLNPRTGHTGASPVPLGAYVAVADEPGCIVTEGGTLDSKVKGILAPGMFIEIVATRMESGVVRGLVASGGYLTLFAPPGRRGGRAADADSVCDDKERSSSGKGSGKSTSMFAIPVPLGKYQTIQDALSVTVGIASSSSLARELALTSTIEVIETHVEHGNNADGSSNRVRGHIRFFANEEGTVDCGTNSGWITLFEVRRDIMIMYAHPIKG